MPFVQAQPAKAPLIGGKTACDAIGASAWAQDELLRG
jgi:hypothetical protein